jgi:hypothetical protein
MFIYQAEPTADAVIAKGFGAPSGHL